MLLLIASSPSLFLVTDPRRPIRRTLRIELARVEDHDIVLRLIDDARDWLWTKGTDQWVKPWPSEAERDERVMMGLAGRKTWIVWDGDTVAATATITPRRNTEVWSYPDCTCDLRERAVFVHRLIVARKYAGLKLGAQLIDWAGVRGQRLYGAKWIRIDVWSSNVNLHRYYMRNGFEPCGNCPMPDYPSGALFQKPVAKIKRPSAWPFREPAAGLQPTPTLDLASADLVLTGSGAGA